MLLLQLLILLIVILSHVSVYGVWLSLLTEFVALVLRLFHFFDHSLEHVQVAFYVWVLVEVLQLDVRIVIGLHVSRI